MNQAIGWLFDVYIQKNNKAIIWIKTKNGNLLKLIDDYTPYFYIKPVDSTAEQELIYRLSSCGGVKNVLIEDKITSIGSKKKEKLIKVEANENNTYRELVKSLGYNPLVSKLYNVGLRHVQKYLFTSLKVEPTSKVQVEYSGNRLLHIEKVDDSLEIMPPPFTMLQLQLDYEGSKGGKTITCIRAKSEDRTETFRGNEYTIIASLLDYISHTDPDLLFCPKCDRIAFPLLKKKAQDNELSLMIGRCDDEEQVRAQGSIGGRIFLEEIFYDFGYEEWGIAGLVERTKFSFAPIGLASRWLSNKSIDSRNCFELTQRGYVIQKEEYNEVSRSLYELIERDRGSITITPEIGRAHENVAALDFDSQYPNIILKNNLSYESISKAEEEFRVIPTVIEPWLKRRLYFKHIKKTLSKDSVLRHQCEQRVDALKLLLVCVTPETEILLKDGYIAISKLESRWKNSNIISVDIGNMRLVDSKIVNYIQLVNGVREFEAYKIETELGHSIIATGEHPFFTMQGWKKAAYLDINDYVAIYLLSNGNLTATQEHAPPKEEPSSRVASEQKIGLENSPFVWEKVSHKRPIHYIKDVRDLVVEPYHSFIANGFVTHNCQYGISGCCWNRFGNVLTFEEINKKSREVMLKAKVTAESNGFRIVYGDTDSLFVNKAGAVKEDYEELATRISDETTLPMSLDRHFKFIAFLPLKCDHSSSALKRYFGLTYDGEVEARGIELRRHDTPSFVRRFQVELIRQVLDCEDIQELYLNGVRRGLEMTRKALKTIKEGKVSFQELIVEKTLRKEVDQYRSNIAHRSAALQLLQRGKEVEVGDSIPFLYINRHHKNPLCRVREPETKSNYDKKAYEKMLIEAASTIFEGIGIQPALTSSTETLEKWFNQTDQ